MKKPDSITVLHTNRKNYAGIVWDADLDVRYLEKYYEWLKKAILWSKAYKVHREGK